MEQHPGPAGLDTDLRGRVVDSICTLLPAVLKHETPGVREATTLMDELGLNSIKGLELMLLLEESIDVPISVEDLQADHFTTVGTLADYVVANLAPEG
jgi:acyl carrier protein